jgi:hypothetical protein
MKKSAAGLVIAVLLTSVVQPAFSAIMAGAACTKKGKVQVVKKYEFTCIKKNGKLVWSAGKYKALGGSFEVGVPTVPWPSASPTPTSSTAPTPTSSPTPTPSPTPTITLDSSDRVDYLISMFANRLKTTEIFQPRNIIEFGKGTIPRYKELISLGIPAAAKFWSSDIKENFSFPIVYSGLEDKDWFISRIDYYGHSSPVWRENLERRITNEGNKLGAAGVSVANGTFLMQFLRGSALTNIYPGEVGTVPHEYTHVIQMHLSGMNTSNLPCWSIEGGANVYSVIIVGVFLNNQGVSPAHIRNGSIRQSYESGEYDLWSADKAEILRLIPLMETDRTGACTFPGKLGYSLGMLISESLIIDYGHQKTLDWWKLSGSMPWREAFKSTFGIEVNDWYRDKAVPYVLSEMKKINKSWLPG